MPAKKKQQKASAPNYARAGVDLERDETFVSEIKEIARGAQRAEVLSGVGGFAGLFKTPGRYRDPVFVAGADGVGTKLKLAAELGRYDTVGMDCVAMVVNDLIVQGAEPLVFLDYLAMGAFDKSAATEALRGVAEGCRRAGCALLGGETASMPGLYQSGDLELVGFGVGVVEREQVIDGSSIARGDVLIGLASSGLHANGFSLVRRVLETGIAASRFTLDDTPPNFKTSLAGVVLTPTRIYVKTVLNLMRSFDLKSVIHITGGGFEGNIPRVLPRGVRARIDPSAWPRPPIFDFLARHGEIAETEMRRVFNCGIGLVLVVHRSVAEEVLQQLQAIGERGYRIGCIEARSRDAAALVFDPDVPAGGADNAGGAGG